jgi:catechol 2,3-dioxygenase-like lactoylglutathione lyase family enzyme
MALSDPPVYHVGIVVSDLEAAKIHLTELLGITWGNNMDIEVNAARDRDGNDVEVPFFLCYSREAPHIELIQEVPGTVWECNEHSNLHHIGFWSDSLVDDVTSFVAARCPLQLSGRDGDNAPVQSAYHRDPLGFTVELVDLSNQPLLEQSLFRAPLA